MPLTDEDLIIAQEKILFDPTIRIDSHELERLLAPDFVDFGRSGIVYSRTAIIEALLREEKAQIMATSFEAKSLSDDVVLLTYRSTRVNSAGNSETLRSSIWKKTAVGWQMVFHQATLITAPRLECRTPKLQ